MAKREFDVWLGTDEDDNEEHEAKRRFASLYHDMLQVVTEQGLASQKNRYRLAAYAVWWHTPKELRVPKFQRDLAIRLGMDDDELFRKWRRQYTELFDETATQTAAERLVLDVMPDIVQASINCAINGGVQGFADRKLLMEIAKVYKPKSSQEITGQGGTDLRIIIDR